MSASNNRAASRPVCSGRCMARSQYKIQACGIAASKKPDSSFSPKAQCPAFSPKSPSSAVPPIEQKLRSDGYREQIAEALYKGIARYAANSRNVKVASARK